jgi:hypothetical protein
MGGSGSWLLLLLLLLLLAAPPTPSSGLAGQYAVGGHELYHLVPAAAGLV